MRETAPIAIDTTPAPQRGWTPALKARFPDRLAAHGNARAACRAVNLSHEAAYRLRRRDPDFARGWAAAVLLARENGTQVLAERAIDGFEEEVWYRGKHVGTRRRYDTRLLLAHLARLDQLADEEAAGADAARFDELVARIAGEEPPQLDDDDHLLPPDRATFAERASIVADNAVTEAWMAETGKPASSTALGPKDHDIYEAECDAAAEQGRADGEAEFDTWFARACAVVDAYAGWSGTRPAAGLPGRPLPCPSTSSGRAGHGFEDCTPLALSLSKGHPELVEGCRHDVAFSAFRTLSHASTSALAVSLAKGAGSARNWPGIDLAGHGPRSPRSASAASRKGTLRRSAIDLAPVAA